MPGLIDVANREAAFEFETFVYPQYTALICIKG